MKERRKQENKLSLLSPTRATTSVSRISSSVSQGGIWNTYIKIISSLKGKVLEPSPRFPELESIEVVRGWKSKILLSTLGNIMQPNI